MSNTPKDEPPRPVTEMDTRLSGEERRLVNIYRQLPVAKQRAIITLLQITLRNPQDAPPTYYKNPWTRDGWIGPPVKDDDNDALRAQHQSALLHNAPQPTPRQPQPGELLMTFEHGQDVYRVELRDFQPHGVETQIFQNGVLLTACRFTVRALAVAWAEKKRAETLRTGGAS
jgi:hypothetical protein